MVALFYFNIFVLCGDDAELINFANMFEYMRKFYHSCTRINTRFTTEEVFEKCVEADGPGGEKCTKEELEEYGDIYVQMFGYIQQFFKETAFPAVTSDWEEATKDWFEGAGWTWYGVAAKVLKDYFYLGAFNEIQTIRTLENLKWSIWSPICILQQCSRLS